MKIKTISKKIVIVTHWVNRKVNKVPQIYLEKPVAIGEHPQHLEEIDKLITKIAEAEEKIAVLQQFKLWLKVMVKSMSY